MLNTFDYNIKMLRNDVGIFTERGGTIAFLLSKDGIVVIISWIKAPRLRKFEY